jgi:hypothetical protein
MLRVSRTNQTDVLCCRFRHQKETPVGSRKVMRNREQNRIWNCGIDRWAITSAYALAFLVTVLTTQLDAQTLSVLHEFTGRGDGARLGGMTKDRAGNLYGSTAYGGDFSCNGGDGGPPGAGYYLRSRKRVGAGS